MWAGVYHAPLQVARPDRARGEWYAHDVISRAGILSLLVVLVGVAFLGFAAGDQVRHVWDKHPRHAGSQHAGAPHVAWKSTPGTSPAPASLAVLPLAGLVAAAGAPVIDAAPARPPFVPPRV